MEKHYGRDVVALGVPKRYADGRDLPLKTQSLLELSEQGKQRVYWWDAVMFKDNTLFVLGAGASAEFWFPTGKQLTENISKRLHAVAVGDLSVDTFIHNALLDYVNGPGSKFGIGIAECRQAARKISTAMPLASSIDSYMDEQRQDDGVQICGQLAIIELISEAEQKSLEGFSKSNELPKNVAQTWLGRFFEILKAGYPYEKVESIFDRVSIINFNYDRSFEHYLSQALRANYGIGENKAFALVAEKLRIIHPYGSIAPWYGDKNAFQFGDRIINRQHLLEMSDRIHTYAKPSVRTDEIRKEVAKARTIVFLGFGYIKENLKLLGIEDVQGNADFIFGTTKGFSSTNQEEVHRQLVRFIKPSLMGSMRFDRVKCLNGKCIDFFGEYSLVLRE